MQDSSTHRAPADKGDVRFEIVSIIEETDDPYMSVLVETIDDTGTIVDRNVFASEHEAYNMIEAHREAQAFTLEERLDMYAERGW